MNDKIQIQVRKDLLESFQSRIDKIARAANKVGVAPPEIEIGEESIQHYGQLKAPSGVCLRGPYESAQQVVDELGSRATPVVVPFVEVVVRNLGRPKIEGWEFVATLEHHPQGTLIRTVPNFEGQLQEYRDADPECDHCQLRRRRKDTYIVQDQNGNRRQVGRSCLRDFIGHGDPEAVAQYFDKLLKLYTSTGGGDYGGDLDEDTKAEAYPSTERFLQLVSEFIIRHGWVSRSQARDDYRKSATADEVWSHLMAPITERVEISEEANSRLESALKWLSQQEPDSDYIHNLKTAAEIPYVEWRRSGILASLFAAHTRYLKSQAREKEEQERLQQAQKLTPHDGDRITIEGRVLSGAFRDSGYGDSVYKVLVEDDRGFRVWGTLPRAIADDKNYDYRHPNSHRVRFDATLKASDGDPYFGFFKRPTKAELLGKSEE